MILIENGYMIDPLSGMEGSYDLLIQGEKIEKIGTRLRSILPEQVLEECHVIDARGLVVAPGLVDVHVHFREPGFTAKEDIDSGARAAAKGGFTTVVLMANTKPCVDNADTLRMILEKGRRTDIHVETCANVTMGMRAKELAPMNELADKGAAGFTDDGIPILDEKVAREAMTAAAKLGLPVSFHEEDPAYIENNGINQGKASAFYQIGGSSRQAEISLVERDLRLALETGACINIQHISAQEAVELVRQAKLKGSNIHAEATPHHFTLTEDDVIEYGTMAKMNPPLREERDRQAIIKGLADGTIDIIATDHAPHTAEEKARPITEAPSGIIGLETALPLAITRLYQKGHLTMMQILEKMSCNPARMYHLDAGHLSQGGPADVILFDPKAKQVMENFVSKSSNTPFTGWELSGKIIMTICSGKMIYKVDQI